jgi:hypothetical protein
MISVSKDCLGGSSWCCMLELMLYCFHSHSNLVLAMVNSRFPVSINNWALFCMICIVGWVVFMSVSGLHSFRFI